MSRTVVALVAVLLLASCATTPTYEVPFHNRSRVYPFGPDRTTEAVQTVLAARGYTVAHVDTATGTVYTMPRPIIEKDSELGGLTRDQWTITVTPAQTGSLVTAACFVEQRKAESWWVDSPVEINQAHRLYLEFLRELEWELTGRRETP